MVGRTAAVVDSCCRSCAPARRHHPPAADRRLADALGVKGSEPQVGGYVHELEAGLLLSNQGSPGGCHALADDPGRAAAAA